MGSRSTIYSFTMNRCWARIGLVGAITVVIITSIHLDRLGGRSWSTSTDSKVEQPHRNRPQLILHAGPGKTATTTAQVAWSKSDRDCLESDGIWYAGRYYNKAKEHREGPETYSHLLQILRGILIPARVIQSNNIQLPMCQGNVTVCWLDFASTLRASMKARPNARRVLVSDEPLALRWNAEHFQNLQESLPEFEIVVVIGYRRLYEWLPASIYQRNKRRLTDTHWPKEGELKSLQPLWPNVALSWSDYHYVTIDRLATEANAAGLAYHVVNLHDEERTLFDQWYCGVLDSPTCCQAHVDSVSKLNVHEAEMAAKMQVDSVVTAAEDVIDTRSFTRATIRDALWERNITLKPLVYCPTREELNRFHHQSWALEKNFVRSDTFDKHQRGFRQRIDAKKFCVVNASSWNKSAELAQFFVQFGRV